MHRKNPVQCCHNTLETTLYMKKTLCNVVQEARDNIAHEKILFNIVVILLGQHCTDKNPVQYCPSDYRQHYTGKKQCIVVWTTSLSAFLFWTDYFFNNNRLLQMPHQHYTNFPDIAQEKSRANIEQKDKIVRSKDIFSVLFEQGFPVKHTNFFLISRLSDLRQTVLLKIEAK